MKILFFHANEIDAPGGAELSVLNLAEGLSKRGHRTGILELAAKQSKRRLACGVPVWSIPWARCPDRRRPGSWTPFLRGVWQFLNVVHEIRPDIVSVQFPSWQSPLVVAAYAFPQKWRLVVTARGSDIRILPFSQPGLRPWQGLLLKRADAVTAVSQSLLRDLLNLYPCVRNKARVIHNSVSPSWSYSAVETHRVAREHYVLFVGTFHSVKGVDILLHAWQRLQRRASGISLWLVGEGPEFNSLIALSNQLGITESVRFLGWKQQDDLPSLYSDAQLVVIPSRSEGLPRVALEAGARGSICVAAEVGGLPEVIEDQVTGFLVKPESPEALADAIMRALELRPEKRQHMSAAAKEKIERRFNQERMLTGYEELFQSLIEEESGAGSSK